MKNLFANPRSAAVISSILYLPAAIIFLFEVLGVSKDFWPLPISPEIIVPVAFLLVPLGLIVSGAPFKLPSIISLLLLLPFLILEWATRSDAPRANASIILWVILWLLSTIFFAILLPVMRNVQVANNIMVNSVSLLPRVVLLLVLAWEWGALVIDQMPCFLGATGC